jgi:hypothetical protein
MQGITGKPGNDWISEDYLLTAFGLVVIIDLLCRGLCARQRSLTINQIICAGARVEFVCFTKIFDVSTFGKFQSVNIEPRFDC